MLRRPTSSPETLRYARESPAGAGPSWCTGTSLVAQTAGHTRVAEVAQEAVARARLVPVDVRLVMAKEVTGDGVVPGFHRSAEERIGRDYDPARDGGGTGGDVARDLVARNLHAPGAENRDADPREIYPLWGSTRARVVLDRVAFHLEVTYGLRRSSFEEHAPAGVVDRVSGEEAAAGVDDGDAICDARDVVANDLGVAGTALDIFAWRVGFGAAYNMVLRHSGVDAPESEDPASDIAYGTVSYNSSVASAFNVDHERPLPCNLEAPDREARNAHTAHALPFELVGFEVHVAEDANSLRSKSLRAGRVCFGSGGRFDHRVVSAQLYPVLADHHVLSVNSPDHDSVARIGSVNSLLNGLARPNDRALRSGGADPRRQYHPTCHQHRQSHGGQQHYGTSHKERRLPSGGGVSSGVRRHSQRPFISNKRSILPYRGRRITQMSYLWCCLGVACG